MRGAARLAVQATLGVTDLVEAVHARIASLPLLPAQRERTLGLSGLVYRSVRGVTQGVGLGLDAALARLETPLGRLAPLGQANEHDALLAALNGVLGDHLAATHNPLAQAMQFRRAGSPLHLGADEPHALLLSLHGLCMNDRQWRHRDHDHAELLCAALGLARVDLRYNTGLPIHANGRLLAQRLEALATRWPGGLRRIVLLGHSMGGLVARSALDQAHGLRWPARVSDLLCLGSPHAGAPLERAGHGVDRLLDAAPYAAPFARLGRLRSAGITSLRHGAVRADGSPAPLPAGVRCFAVAGRLRARALGDGLVPVASALGQGQLQFPPAHQAVFERTGHLGLLASPAVTAQLLAWLRAEPAKA